MIHEMVFVISLVLMAGVLAAFAYVALKASQEEAEYVEIQARSYSMRAKFFWLLVVAGIVVAFVTTIDLPFAATRGDLSRVDKKVDVAGGQWYWQINESSAKAGETVVFDVRTLDVTHGLGVYDPDMRLIGQTQAMPGYTNSLKLTLDQPGTYKLLCMEYCGVAHHVMMSDFTVEP